MGINAGTLCQYFPNESSKFAINGLSPIAEFESEAVTLRPCARSESKTADESCLLSLIASRRDEASLRPWVLSESRIADGSDLASSMASPRDPRFPTLRDEVTLPISSRGRMSGFWIDPVSSDGSELSSQIYLSGWNIWAVFERCVVRYARDPSPPRLLAEFEQDPPNTLRNPQVSLGGCRVK
jgi:hypothetical protein